MKFKTIFLAILVINLIVGLASALTISSVESMPGEINPGEKVTLSLTIENNLDQDVENVVVSLDLKDVPFAPYHSSNEVSFEKIKEELRSGATYRKAVRDGFKGAMVVILDSNITTLITGLILFKFGGPAIKGFAVTLMAGIIATVLSGVYFLRSVFDFILDNFDVKKIGI